MSAGSGSDLPIVVPTQYVVHDAAVWMHLSSKNPVFDRLEIDPRAILSVAGDWAFVPGAWKAIGDEDPDWGIPTTYYGAVQVVGRVEVRTDPEAVAETLRIQRRILEPGAHAVDPLAHGPKLAAIRGIRLPLTEVRAKFKYGGNVDEAHRAAIAEHLRLRGTAGDHAARRHIRIGDPRDGSPLDP